MVGSGWDADADGDRIRIAASYLEKLPDDQVAAVMAHELAHNILRHRARLDAAKVNRGFLKELGRSGRMWRQTEDEADRLSPYLLYNAGYDPAGAIRFWEGQGPKINGGIFRSPMHANAIQRRKQIAAEVAQLHEQPRPYLPPMLQLRDQPLR